VLNIWVSSSIASYMVEADKPEGGNLTCLQNHSFLIGRHFENSVRWCFALLFIARVKRML